MKLIATLTVLLIPAIQAFSQANNELYNNGTIVHISTGAEVHVLGDVHMRGSGGLLNNYGLLKLDGNMYSDNLFQQRGTGTTRIQNNLVNTGMVQKISGSYAVRSIGSTNLGIDDGSFYNLELANSQGVVWLETAAIAGNTPYVADVRNSVNFLYSATYNRVITHNPAALPTNGNGYSAVFGVMNSAAGIGSMVNNTVTINGNMSSVDAGYIQGKLRRRISPAGGVYGFVMGLEPAGAGMQRGMQYMEMNFAANSYDVVHGYFQTALDNTFPTQMECSGYMIDYWGGVDHGQWVMTNYISGQTWPFAVQVWCQDDNFPVKSIWMVTKNNSIMGTPNECGPSPVGLVRTGFDGTGGIGQFDVAASDVNILPVDLIKIWAESMDDYIKVNWAIASEEDLSHYDLERSLDGLNFNYLTTVAAVGNTSSPVTYSYDDYNVLREVDYFYRYKAVDNDGTSYYSPVVQGRLSAAGGESLAESVYLYPNPADQTFNVGLFTGTEKSVKIQIYNTVGQIVFDFEDVFASGYTILPIAVAEWADGMYNIKIEDLNSEEVVWEKFIKQ